MATDRIKIKISGDGNNIHTWKFYDAETGKLLPVSKFEILGDIHGDGFVRAMIEVIIEGGIEITNLDAWRRNET